MPNPAPPATLHVGLVGTELQPGPELPLKEALEGRPDCSKASKALGGRYSFVCSSEGHCPKPDLELLCSVTVLLPADRHLIAHDQGVLPQTPWACQAY